MWPIYSSCLDYALPTHYVFCLTSNICVFEFKVSVFIRHYILWIASDNLFSPPLRKHDSVRIIIIMPDDLTSLETL